MLPEFVLIFSRSVTRNLEFLNRINVNVSKKGFFLSDSEFLSTYFLDAKAESNH